MDRQDKVRSFNASFNGYVITYYLNERVEIYDPFGQQVRSCLWSYKDDTLVITDFNNTWKYSDNMELLSTEAKIWSTFKHQYAIFLFEEAMKGQNGN